MLGTLKEAVDVPAHNNSTIVRPLSRDIGTPDDGQKEPGTALIYVYDPFEKRDEQSASYDIDRVPTIPDMTAKEVGQGSFAKNDDNNGKKGTPPMKSTVSPVNEQPPSNNPTDPNSQTHFSYLGNFIRTLQSLLKYTPRFLSATAPAVFFAALSLDNVRPFLLGLYVGEVVMGIERVLYPALCSLVNYATADESQDELLNTLRKLWKSDATLKDRVAFVFCALAAVIAAVATIPMAKDGAAKMGMKSENSHLELLYTIIAIFLLSVLYTVVTRCVNAFKLFFEETPDFFSWLDRKYHLLLNKDPDHLYFKVDVARFINKDLKTERQFRALAAMLEKIGSSARHEGREIPQLEQLITDFLQDNGYQIFPSKMKLFVSSTLSAGCPIFSFLLYNMSHQGANTLGLHENAAKMIAILSVILAEIFYLRACIKYPDRIINSFNAMQQAFFPKSPYIFLLLYSFMWALIALTTSAGFVYEGKKYTKDMSRVIQILHELYVIFYAGGVANGGYTALKAAELGQARLDAIAIRELCGTNPAAPVVAAGVSAKAQAFENKSKLVNAFNDFSDDSIARVREKVTPFAAAPVAAQRTCSSLVACLSSFFPSKGGQNARASHASSITPLINSSNHPSSRSLTLYRENYTDCQI